MLAVPALCTSVLWLGCLHSVLVRAENKDSGVPDCDSFLHGRVSSCETYQIATLNSSPPRCLHIEGATLDDKSQRSAYCTDFINWFDGTNGCRVYGLPQNKDWCDIYGGRTYTSTPHTAKQACCVCGGGVERELEFQVGDFVRVPSLSWNCKSVRVSKILESQNHAYTVEFLENCGQKHLIRTNRGIQQKHMYETGQLLKIPNDQIAKMTLHRRLELRKCRTGSKEQEFSLVPDDVKSASSSGKFTIYHPLTDTEISLSLGESKQGSNALQIDPAFEGDTFTHALDFFHITFHGPSSSNILLSGMFGETEYAEAVWTQIYNRNYHESPYSMWSFEKIERTNDTTSDEHTVWLEKMTESLGIQYLQQLAPWHLLDVDRAASKSDVKLRFRELSRTYHPDKVLPEKREQSSKIFVLLQNAYEGLKNTDEAQKEAFRTSADTDSQLFSHSQHVIELLPFHWTKYGNDADYQYVIKTNATNSTATKADNGSVQIWLLFLYSARCGMSRSIEGYLDLAAGHLEKENIKVGAYGCGLYDGFTPNNKDITGVLTDEICKQYKRRETPNVHVVVETISGDDNFVEDNAQFKYFKSDVPTGNTTHLSPKSLINFAVTGKRIWKDMHLVKKMKKEDFVDEAFMTNISIVAFFDATNSDTSDVEVQGAITSFMPTLARRFYKAGLYVGIARCGSGYEENAAFLDCSEYGVGWLPDVKMFGKNETEGISLIRGNFGDRRDVQIAMESMSNVLSLVLDAEEDLFDDDLEDLNDEKDEGSESGGSCSPPADAFASDFDLEEIEDSDTMMLDAPDIEDKTTKPKLAESNKPKLSSQRQERIMQFESRKPIHRGSGRVIGGSSSSGGGAIGGR